jgi:hypothetical protein
VERCESVTRTWRGATYLILRCVHPPVAQCYCPLGSWAREATVGQGVVDSLGGSAWKKWEIRVFFVNARVRATARGLLTGQQVLSADDAVVIRWTAAEGARGTLRVRDADLARRFVLDITVHALSQQEIAALPVADPVGVAASVDRWVKVTSPSTQTWELFNCLVEDVFIGRA